MAELIKMAKGISGQIEVYDGKIRIVRKGFTAFMLHGLKGDKDILASSISSIQFKPAGMMTNGYIQFAFMGGAEAKRGLFQATQDENTVMFNKGQQPAFEEVRQLVEGMVNPVQARTSSVDASDQIEKLAALRDKGLITDEEFTASKRKALGI